MRDHAQLVAVVDDELILAGLAGDFAALDLDRRDLGRRLSDRGRKVDRRALQIRLHDHVVPVVVVVAVACHSAVPPILRKPARIDFAAQHGEVRGAVRDDARARFTARDPDLHRAAEHVGDEVGAIAASPR